ncbi:MAG: hypothetical protein GC136_06910 [Alphaproteobacteria bacterium]|nr:hypothetical protein [Alphaproteobacteria bacterium]
MIISEEIRDAALTRSFGISSFRLKPQFNAAIISSPALVRISRMLPENFDTGIYTIVATTNIFGIKNICRESWTWAGVGRYQLEESDAPVKAIIEEFHTEVAPLLGDRAEIMLMPSCKQRYNMGYKDLVVTLPMGAKAEGITLQDDTHIKMMSASGHAFVAGGRFERSVDYAGTEPRYILRATRRLI